MDTARIEELKRFIDECKSNPSIIHEPSLDFFRSYLQSLGARIPSRFTVDNEEPGDDYENDIIESDIELDNSGVVEPDNDPPQKMGDPSGEVLEENQDSAQTLKAKAIVALNEGKIDEAINQLTEAITLNPRSAIMYASRANIFVRMQKPNAAIRDADEALKINPDSAKGYKVRGMARAMLGHWEEAAKDLHVASKLDFDEEIASVLRKVESNGHKIEEHRRKYERLRKENETWRIEREKHRQHAKAEEDAKTALSEGQVMVIHSVSEINVKLSAANKFARLAVLYFTATWCGPCRFISPVVTTLACQYPDVAFLKIDIDEARDVASRWNISSVPTFFFIKNGKEVDIVVGADKSSLESKVSKYA